ncbi:class I SAM-dependent methyltransferase [Roseiconus lacunae]|uniref:Class I SAM-dependent methyltransferase n=1 Tax=Roseiconus lacunae TaxID=2605694 RepID=A0ABT7PPC0_9BACT|nr:class I SAM-dependent methyltransferase [Roseiconus lacunae]MDM4018332.1 class I SAM-dependent methyltransferase [Roseiconus lacunae]
MASNKDRFFEPYDREEIAYGDTPSAPLAAYLRQICRTEASGDDGFSAAKNLFALDLGAGAGRDTIAMARAGFSVTAVDLSPRGGERIMQRATEQGVSENVKTQVANVCEFEIQPSSYDLICATTVLDHISESDSKRVWLAMLAGLKSGGALYVEVHSTEDPGSDQSPGLENKAPVSETADAVINYFPPNRLLGWATQPRADLRVLRYEERLEWDYTHGPEHLHGKAILLAVKSGTFPPWYGQPAAFPRR